MPTVHIPADLRELTGGARSVAVEGTTLAEVINALDARHAGIKSRLIEGQRLRPGLAAVIDSQELGPDLETSVGQAREIYFVRAISGGSGAPSVLRSVGTSPIRHDGVDKVTGHALYGIDARMANMLYGKVLRSPHAHARIVSIDTSRAEALPGVHAVVTARDLPDPSEGKLAANEQGAAPIQYKAMNMVARDKVLYHGHAIAAVAAVDIQTADDAIKLIDVRYETLPAVLDGRAAMQADAPILHPDLRTERGGKRGSNPTNVALHVTFEEGDVERAFSGSDLVVEREFTSATVHQGYIEPHAAAVYWRRDGEIIVQTSTQGHFMVRDELAALLRCPASKVHVTPLEIGGGFGGKTTSWLELLAAMLSRKSGRPVKLTMTRTEVLMASGPAAGAWCRVKIGATKDGRITALTGEIVLEAGAFPSSPIGPAAMCALGLYDLEHFRVEGYEVVVNKPKTIAYRAPGAPQSIFAVESVIDEICVGLDIDPLEFRLRNAATEGSLRADGTRFGRIGMRECLEAAKASAHWRSALPTSPGRRCGRGIAAGFWLNGGLRSSVAVRLAPDGSVTLLEGSPDIGGTRTSIALQFAETLGIAASDVHPIVADTDTVGVNDLTGGSRTTFATGLVAHHAAIGLRENMIAGLAKVWLVPANEIAADGGAFRSADRSVTLKEAANILAAAGIHATATVSMQVTGVGPAYAVHIADVEIDEETGKTHVVRYTAVQDVGRAVYPPYVEGQIEGGVAQGIGWALNEEYWYDDEGHLRNASLLDYRMPTALDLPMIETIIVEVPNPSHPYGVRGVGEVPIVPPLPTIANAIHNAVGVRMRDLPITPARLFQALCEAAQKVG